MYGCMSGNMLACKAGIFCHAKSDTYYFGTNALPPSWMLKLTESWGKSKTDFKGEVGGFKIYKGEGERRKTYSLLPTPPPFPPHLP